MSQSRKKQLLKATLVVGTAVFIMANANTDTVSGLGGISQNINKNLKEVAKLISQAAFVAGMGFFLAGLFKFKQHKDNPTQVPVGTPLTMIAIAAAMMFMSNFITPLGQTFFGDDAKAGVTNEDALSGLNAG